MYDYLRVAYYLNSLLLHTRWSLRKLLDYQNKKIREVVSYAYSHVPLYHEKIKQLGLKAEELKTIKDLNKLPIFRRTELQENTRKRISDEFNVAKLRMISTSGTTGHPLLTYITRKEDAFRKAKLLRVNMICGQKPRDRWVVVTAPQHQAHTYNLQKFLGIFRPIPVSVFDDVATQISKIERIKPHLLDGYSSSLLLLAREVENRGIETVRPRIIIGGAELIDDSERQYIEKVFKAPFYDEYASVELGRLAWQCEERAEYHIDADSVIMQFVDEDGEEVAPGERGEIVCTSLFNYAMPFIRYALGDIGVRSEETDCPCSRAFQLMKIIEGRKESVVVLPDDRVLSPLAIGDCMCAFKYFGNTAHYRFIQKRIDFFKILIKKKDCSVEDEVMKAELAAHFRKMLNLSESEATIEIEFMDEIPLDKSGKLRKVVSELHN